MFSEIRQLDHRTIICNSICSDEIGITTPLLVYQSMDYINAKTNVEPSKDKRVEATAMQDQVRLSKVDETAARNECETQ